MNEIKKTETDIVVIAFCKGKFIEFYFDPSFDEAFDHKWSVQQTKSGNYYLYSTEGIAAHRYVMGTNLNKGMRFVVNHIDKNTTNNRKSNLEYITNRANIIHSRDIAHFKRNNSWTTSIRKDGKKVNLGHFDTKEQAVEQYNRAYSMIETCTVKDLIDLRNKFKRKSTKAGKLRSTTKGFYFDKKRNKYIVDFLFPLIQKNIYLGWFDTEAEAYQQYQKALAIIHNCTLDEMLALRPNHKKPR